jgi:hypothetical protein
VFWVALRFEPPYRCPTPRVSLVLGGSHGGFLAACCGQRAMKPIEIRPPVDVRARLGIEANKRGITLTELCATIQQVTAQDGRVDD